MKRALLKYILGLFFTMVHLVVLSQDFVEIPSLKRRVTDLTGTLSTMDISELERNLEEFENTKGSQVVVLIVPSTQPEEIEEYSIRVAEKWKIGRDGVDDGVILLIAKNDRKLRIEVGYGLEGAIPDIYAKRIIDQVIVPHFRNGNFSQGVKEGVGAILGLINGEDLPEVTQSNQNDSDQLANSIIFVIFFGLVGLSFIKALVTNKIIKMIILGVFIFLVLIITKSIVFTVFSFFLGLSFLFGNSNGGGSSGGGRYFRGGGFYGGGFSSGGGFGGGGFSGGGGSFGGGGSSGGW